GRAEVVDAVHPGGLGGTFGGNPVSSAAACVVLDGIRTPEFRERADEIGRVIRSRLEQLAEGNAEVGEIRGLGPMLALELAARNGADSKRATTYAREEGFLLLACGFYR